MLFVSSFGTRRTTRTALSCLCLSTNKVWRTALFFYSKKQMVPLLIGTNHKNRSAVSLGPELLCFEKKYAKKYPQKSTQKKYPKKDAQKNIHENSHKKNRSENQDLFAWRRSEEHHWFVSRKEGCSENQKNGSLKEKKRFLWFVRNYTCVVSRRQQQKTAVLVVRSDQKRTIVVSRKEKKRWGSKKKKGKEKKRWGSKKRKEPLRKEDLGLFLLETTENRGSWGSSRSKTNSTSSWTNHKNRSLFAWNSTTRMVLFQARRPEEEDHVVSC